MQLAIVAAGFSPGEADHLRRSMAAWRRRGGLEQFEQRLIDGMAARGYGEDFARQIYQQILGFGEYGFPESHSASFALLVYVSAWLKCHHPAAFCAALINSQPMGFYAPSQLVQDARRHGVEVLPVDVTVSEWDCTLEKPSGAVARTGVARVERSETRGNRAHCHNHPGFAPLNPGYADPGHADPGHADPGHADPGHADPGHADPGHADPGHADPAHALRLGLRLVGGLSAAGAQRIVAARRAAPFTSVADLAHRGELDRRDLARLGDAGALAALAGHRHAAVWDVAGIERLPPLLAGSTFAEEAPALPPPTEGQDIVADYRTLGLTLRRHPLALLRDRLRQRRISTAADIGAAPHGRIVRTAGIVIGRQRPDTASGVIFVTLEDETGPINVIVWRDLGDRQRRELLGAKLLAVYGKVEREGPVVHVLAGRLADLSPLLGELPARSRDFH